MRRVMLLVAALLCASVTFAQATVGVKVKSQVLGEERTVYIGTPRQYETSDTRYPVVYLTDAEAQFNHTLTTAEFLARNGRIPPVIVVGITNTQRTRDFTPTPHRGQSGGETYRNPGGAAKFREFVDTELIPYIDAKYRTVPYRVFSGHSFGALFAIDTLLTKPSMFNGIIAVSPTLDWDDDLELKNAKAFFANRKEFPATLFVALGNEGALMQRGFDSFRAILKKQRANGFSYAMEQYKDEDHGSVVLPATYAGLKKMFEEWPLPVDPETRTVLGGWQGVKAHYRHLSDKYGFPVPIPENIANLAGYQFLNEKKFHEAVEVLKANAETYPKSPNVYDSLGEAYEKSGERELALQNYEKAMKLGAETNDVNASTFKANYERLAKSQK